MSNLTWSDFETSFRTKQSLCLDVVAADSSETERAVAPRYNANPRYNMRKRSAYK